MTSTPSTGLREVVHQRVRLGVLAVLAQRGPCTFSELRDLLAQSDGGLSRHLGVLEKHELITTEKVFDNRRPKTWVHLTPAGTEAFREEQSLLTELLASVPGEKDDERTAALATAFAALAGEDLDPEPADGVDRSELLPVLTTLDDRDATQVASGAVSARYDFPAEFAEFGQQLRDQRLMMISHGLRGGWIATWYVAPDGGDPAISAQVLLVELADAANCDAILAVMGTPTVELPGTDGTRGHLLTDDSRTTALAWFSVGRHLISTVVVSDGADTADTAVTVLGTLVAETRISLSPNES